MKLNLLPDVAKFQAEKIKFSKKVMSVMVSVLTVWVVALIIVMTFYWVNKIKFSKAEDKYITLENDYIKMSKEVVINQILRRKAKLVSQILGERFEYGETFAKMESLFENNVVIGSMELKDRYSFSLTGSVFGGELMDMVEERIDDINNGLVDEFLEASLVSVSVENDKWSFGLEVTLK
jgi:hypothetical protein